MLRRFLPIVRSLLPLFWRLQSLRWPPRARRAEADSRKHVLLTAHNELMARYLREVADIVGQDRRVELALARAPFVDRGVPLEEIESRLGAPAIPFGRALMKEWDLVISADHYPAFLFHPRIKKLFVSHGIAVGLIREGSDYVYGERSITRSGEPLYAKMFAAGPAEQAFALGVNPRLEGAVSVVGSIETDAFLARNRRREEIRADLGVDPSDTVVIIMSTWGERSLIETVGLSLVEEAKRLEDGFHFILTIHPNNYTRAARGRDWSRFMAEQRGDRVSVVGPREPVFDYLVAADIAVTDYTSLALYFAQLVRPLVFVRIDRSRFAADAPILRLYDLCPKLDEVSDLRHRLEEALKSYPLRRLEELAGETVAYRGRARQRVAEEIYGLLGLPVVG